VTIDYRAGLIVTAIFAVTYAFGRVRLWLERRRTAAVEQRAEHAEAERDREHAAAVGAARTAELTTAQREADHAADVAAGAIEHAPTTGDPVADVRAIDRAARELRDADGARPDGGHGGAPAVPPRR